MTKLYKGSLSSTTVRNSFRFHTSQKIFNNNLFAKKKKLKNDENHKCMPQSQTNKTDISHFYISSVLFHSQPNVKVTSPLFTGDLSLNINAINSSDRKANILKALWTVTESKDAQLN